MEPGDRKPLVGKILLQPLFIAAADTALAEAGTDKVRILTAQVWLSDMANIAAMNAVWNAWVDPENKPVRATVEAAMARDVLLVEIQVTAALDKNAFEDLNY